MLTQRQAGSGTSNPSTSSSSSWWQSFEKWWQASSWDEQFFIKKKKKQLQGVSLTGIGDSLLREGWCKHHTNPTHTSHFRTRDFSRLAQDLSHRVRNRCLSQNSHSSHQAQHVTRALAREATMSSACVCLFSDFDGWCHVSRIDILAHDVCANTRPSDGGYPADSQRCQWVSWPEHVINV